MPRKILSPVSSRPMSMIVQSSTALSGRLSPVVGSLGRFFGANPGHGGVSGTVHSNGATHFGKGRSESPSLFSVKFSTSSNHLEPNDAGEPSLHWVGLARTLETALVFFYQPPFKGVGFSSKSVLLPFLNILVSQSKHWISENYKGDECSKTPKPL